MIDFPWLVAVSCECELAVMSGVHGLFAPDSAGPFCLGME